MSPTTLPVASPWCISRSSDGPDQRRLRPSAWCRNSTTASLTARSQRAVDRELAGTISGVAGSHSMPGVCPGTSPQTGLSHCALGPSLLSKQKTVGLLGLYMPLGVRDRLAAINHHRLELPRLSLAVRGMKMIESAAERVNGTVRIYGLPRPLLILFTESLKIGFAVRIEGLLVALLPCSFKFGR